MHKFVILLNGELRTYNRFEDIPLLFNNLIEFRPSVSEGPHTEEEHAQMETWNLKLQELLKRETK